MLQKIKKIPQKRHMEMLQVNKLRKVARFCREKYQKKREHFTKSPGLREENRKKRKIPEK